MIKSLLLLSAVVSWNPPAPIEGVTVANYIGYYSTNITGPFLPVFTTTGTNHDVGPLKSGRHFYFITAVGDNGFESDPSNKAFQPVINPPRDSVITRNVP